MGHTSERKTALNMSGIDFQWAVILHFSATHFSPLSLLMCYHFYGFSTGVSRNFQTTECFLFFTATKHFLLHTKVTIWIQYAFLLISPPSSPSSPPWITTCLMRTTARSWRHPTHFGRGLVQWLGIAKAEAASSSHNNNNTIELRSTEFI